MKQIGKINLSFSQYTDSAFGDKAGAIYDGMNNSTLFTNPVPTMEVVNTSRLAYLAALEKASSRSRNDIVVKNFLRQALTDLLVELGHYVTLTAKGNLGMLTESRFNLRKNREPKPELQQPKNLQLVNGINPGMLIMSVDAVRGARSYSFEYTADPIGPDSVWVKIAGTTRKCTISNLQSGQKIWARVAAVGVRNQFTYSEIQGRTIQ